MHGTVQYTSVRAVQLRTARCSIIYRKLYSTIFWYIKNIVFFKLEGRSAEQVIVLHRIQVSMVHSTTVPFSKGSVCTRQLRKAQLTTALHNTFKYYKMLYSTVQYFTLQHSIIDNGLVQFSKVKHNTWVLHSPA
jgi:hypothetical protein